MKYSFKHRAFSLFLAVLMVITMIPAMCFTSFAATTKDFDGCTVADLGISATDANGSGTAENAPVCNWTAIGSNLTGSLVGGKDPEGPKTYYYESTSTLTLTNNKKTQAELSFKYAGVF